MLPNSKATLDRHACRAVGLPYRLVSWSAARKSRTFRPDKALLYAHTIQLRLGERIRLAGCWVELASGSVETIG